MIGSAAAMLFARVGARVLVVERDAHPRFAIGEATVPATQEGFKALAEAYGVPELYDVHNFPRMKRAGLAAWAKAGFHFNVHCEGRPLENAHQVMFETFPLPRGPDVHIYRADADAYLVDALSRYGVDYVDLTELVDHRVTGRRVEVDLVPRGSQGGTRRTVSCGLALDCMGRRSPLVEKYELAVEPGFHTDSRAIFAHFTGVPLFEHVAAPNHAFRYRRDAGTVHHCFAGGWIWVIPFDNGITSVGICLDRTRYPDRGRSPEDEASELIARFPSMAEHLGHLTPIDRWRSAARLQHETRSMSAPGLLLAPSTAGFIDPLFSFGLSQGAAFLHRVVPLVRDGLLERDLAVERFAPVERMFRRELAHSDTIISGCYRSFADYECFKQMWCAWLHGSLLEGLPRTCLDPSRLDDALLLMGSGISAFTGVVSEMHSLLPTEPGGTMPSADTLHAILQRIPRTRADYDWSVGSESGFAATFPFFDTAYLRWWLAQPEVVAAGASIARMLHAHPQALTARRRLAVLWRALTGFRSSPERTAVDRIYAVQNKRGLLARLA